MNQNPIPSMVQQVMPAVVRSGLGRSFCTIQAPNNTYGPSGAPIGGYTNVAGMVNISCMDAPPSVARVQATEVKALAEIMSKGMRHLLLFGFFPQLVASSNEGPIGQGGVAKGWRANVTEPDGTVITYDILGAESDSQTTQTRLELQLVGV